MNELTAEQFEEIRLAVARYMGSDPNEVTMMISGGDKEQVLADIKADLDELKAERKHIEAKQSS